MRLVRYSDNGGTPRAGVIVGAEIVDIGAVNPRLTPVVLAHLNQDAIDAVAVAVTTSPRVPIGEVTFLSPIARPPKFLAIGLNYLDHVREAHLEPPQRQLWFNKQSTCVVGPNDPIRVPSVSEMVDYEGELALVIKCYCRHVSVENAMDVVAGFTICNDVSVRDWQRASPTMTMGKSFDTHGPLGPFVVTPDELGDGNGLSIRTFVNDEIRQNGNTSDLIFTIPEMIAHLTSAFTLEPGDVITTGTPAGTGSNLKPPVWLRAGDIVRVDIEGIGSLENPVEDEVVSSFIGAERREDD